MLRSNGIVGIGHAVLFQRRPPSRVSWGVCAFQGLPLVAGIDDEGAVCRVGFRNDRAPRALLDLWRRDWPAVVWTENVAVADRMQAVFRGESPARLRMVGTDFQHAVWTQLMGIPAGQTISYGALARRIGKPKAARAVGTACGANPLPILVPCHRVVASDGSLGGFAGGLAAKRVLLAAESAA